MDLEGLNMQMEIINKIKNNPKKYLITLGVLVLLALIVDFAWGYRVKIVSVLPKDGWKEVARDAYVKIVFKNPVSYSEVSLVTISIEPDISHRVSWERDTELFVMPINPWDADTTYTVKIFRKKRVLEEFSFTTAAAITEEMLQQQALDQTRADLDTVEIQKEFYAKYPWAEKLPIKENDYAISYNEPQNKIAIILFVEENDILVDVVKKEAFATLEAVLESVGVTTADIEYYYKFSSRN
jgi:hypothetical protein